MTSGEVRKKQCRFCKSLVEANQSGLDCPSCLSKGDAIGRVVWKSIVAEVRNAPRDTHVLFMLTGLSARTLEGVVRESPNEEDLVEGRTWLMRLHPKAAKNLKVFPPAKKSKKPATYWRHSSEAQVKLFAVPDRDRHALGASLGEVVRIDEEHIIGQIDEWAYEVNPDPELDLEYLINMLGGLGDSRILSGLDMWIDFINALKCQKSPSQLDQRVQNVGYTLQIPNGSISGLPKASDTISKAERRKFRSAFNRAEQEVKCFPMLESRTQGEQIDPEVICKAIQNFPDQSDDAQLAFAYILTLLSDHDSINPGGWRFSQENFCRNVPWHKIGAPVFRGGARKVKRNLGQETLNFIKKEVGSSSLTAEDLRVLEDMIEMGARNPKEPIIDEVKFYERWKDFFGRPDADAKRLNSEWRKRISATVVFGDDLITTLFDGFTALVNSTGETLSSMHDPKIVVRAGKSSESKYWTMREPRSLKQFQFELKSLQGLLGNFVDWQVNACFPKKIQSKKNYTAESQQMEMTLHLREGPQETNNEIRERDVSPFVTIVWRPEVKVGGDPVSFGLSEDIEALSTCAKNDMSMFRRLNCKPTSKSDGLSGSQVSLSNLESFRDVLGDHNGRLFGQFEDKENDIFEEVRGILHDVENAGDISQICIDGLLKAIDGFTQSYKEMIIKIHRNVKKGFSSDLIENAAQAYGNLCSATRACGSSDKISDEVSTRIASICIVEVDDDYGTAILAGWHPFRLAERKAKIKKLNSYILDTIEFRGSEDRETTLSILEQRNELSGWNFPEIVILGKRIMVISENLSGYGLFRSSEEWKVPQVNQLGAASFTAAQVLVECIDRYLLVHPHKETFLSVSIFESEEKRFPRDVIEHLVNKVHAMPNLNCNLILTQKNIEKLHDLFQHQNQKLQSLDPEGAPSNFLPKLRVSTCLSSDLSAMGSHAVDIAFLYGVISSCSEYEWIFEPVSTESLSSEITLEGVNRPRRWLTESANSKEAIYITMPRPPRSISEYNNLVFEIKNKPSRIPESCHAAYIKAVDYGCIGISDALVQSHEIADWVVTYDLFADKEIFKKNGVRIIRDVSAPSIEGRQIISTKVMDIELQDNIRSYLDRIMSEDTIDTQNYCDKIVDKVLHISGQKLLTAARSVLVSYEVIGVCIMQAVMESSSKISPNAAIWISLDDHRDWLLPGGGRCADAILLSILDEDGSFKLNMHVGEAKFVSKDNKRRMIESAGSQLRQTLKALQATFVDNLDSPAGRFACSRLARLLGYQSGLAVQLTNTTRRQDFISSLSLGNVKICIAGEAVISVHDDIREEEEVESYYDDRSDCISYSVLPAKRVAETLTNVVNNRHASRRDIVDLKWRCSIPSGDICGNERTVTSEPMDLTNSDGLADEQIHHESQQSFKDTTTEDQKNSTSDVVESANISYEMSVNFGEKKVQTPVRDVNEILNEMKEQEDSSTEDDVSLDWAEEMCEKVQDALLGLRMQAKFAEPKFRLTPSGVLVSFRGHQTLTAGKVRRKISELLTIYCIHVIDIREGVGTVSLFIERKVRANVGLASTWLSTSRPKEEEHRALTFLVGVRDDDGSPLFLNLAEEWSGYEEHGPHTLIGGETGSGKGIFTQGILLQLVMFNDPKDIQLIVIDPKRGVDYNWVTGFPHMREGLVTEVEHAHETFHCLVEEMEKRYEIFRTEDAENIKQYNSKVTAEERIPRIVLVHDELGAWMAQVDDYRDTVLSYVANLGMKSRAAGIHLVLITQRADAEAVPPRLRDNMGNRFCFKVQNMIGSKMVLGKGGAEKLLGKGHLACHLANQRAPVGQEYFLVQVPYADVKDVRRLAEAALRRWSNS